MLEILAVIILILVVILWSLYKLFMVTNFKMNYYETLCELNGIDISSVKNITFEEV